MSEIESFEKLGRSYQEKVLQALFEDPTYAEMMTDVFEGQYFTYTHLQKMAEILFDYRSKYKEFPSIDVATLQLQQQYGDEDPALMKIYADKDSPRANGEGWHSDVSCDLEPPMGSILYIKQCPPRGGDTLFANMYAAYEALSDRMKAYLDGLTALHDGASVYRGLYANYGVADKQDYPHAEHPVVRTHPVTGKKALYVNRGFTRHISGIPRDESDAMLAYLYQHAENPLFQCRFRWTENAIAFWDNRCTQHRAMWDYWPHTRSGTRVTVKGERPV